MARITKRRTAVVAAVGALLAAAPLAAYADGTSTLTATTVAGSLTVTGAGAATGNVTPGGGFQALTGATTLTVSDLRGSTAGWHVTAQYQAATVGKDLGGANVQVTTGNPLGDALVNMNVFSNVSLAAPATVLNTNGGGSSALSGAGVSTATASFKVQVPATAQATDVYNGSVVFTVTTG